MKWLKHLKWLVMDRQRLQLNNGIIEVNRDGFWGWRCTSMHSLRRACKEFESIKGSTIVEIGSGLHSRLAGCSMLEWTSRTSATDIHAVDMDEDRINEVRDALGTLVSVKPVVADGMVFLNEFEGQIDLLYLDFWIPDPPESVVGTGRAQAYLECYENAKSKLSSQALILIDDTDHVIPWKHSEIIQAARQDGFYPLWIGRQTMLRRDDQNRSSGRFHS